MLAGFVDNEINSAKLRSDDFLVIGFCYDVFDDFGLGVEVEIIVTKVVLAFGELLVDDLASLLNVVKQRLPVEGGGGFWLSGCGWCVGNVDVRLRRGGWLGWIALGG